MTRKGVLTHARLQREWPQHLNKRTIWRGWKSSPMGQVRTDAPQQKAFTR